MAFDMDFRKDGFARHLFRLRFRDLQLSQRAFAKRFGLGFSMVRDIEQGKRMPSPAMMVLIEAIADDPERMARIAAQSDLACECGASRETGCCAYQGK